MLAHKAAVDQRPRRFFEMLLRPISLLFLATMGTTPAAATDIRTSGTFGKTCISAIEEQGYQRTCAGPSRYVAVIRDRDQVMTVDLGHQSAGISDRSWDEIGVRWRGPNPRVGSKIEWRLRRGTPFAAIFKIFTTASDERPLDQFLVLKVTPTGACEIARVDVSDSNAYSTARDLADSQAASITCAPK